MSWELLQAAYDRLPPDVFTLLLTYIPPKPKPVPPRYPAGLQRKLEALQTSSKRTAMDLKGLEDFVLPK